MPENAIARHRLIADAARGNVYVVIKFFQKNFSIPIKYMRVEYLTICVLKVYLCIQVFFQKSKGLNVVI